MSVVANLLASCREENKKRKGGRYEVALGVFSSQKDRKKSLLLHIKKLPTCYLYPLPLLLPSFLRHTGFGDSTTNTLFRMSVILQKLRFSGVVAIGSLQGARLHEEGGVTPSLLVFAEWRAVFGSFVISGFNSAMSYSHSMLRWCYGGFFAFFIVSTTSCLFVSSSHTPAVLSCFFFFLTAWSLQVCCILHVILYVASIAAGGYAGSLVLDNLVQRLASLIATCLSAKTSRFYTFSIPHL